MLIPYKDSNPTRRFPIITILLLIANIGIFVYFAFVSDFGLQKLTRQFALIPVELSKGNLPDSKWISPYLTFATYMFFHANIPHLLFNMLFLWIFGNNVEDGMSRIGFLMFYILVGAASALVYIGSDPTSKISLIGASGAISGILGAYLFMYPLAKIHALFFIFPVKMPAVIFLLIWFFLQISGLLGPESNVAWESHISGFILGILTFRIFKR